MSGLQSFPLISIVRQRGLPSDIYDHRALWYELDHHLKIYSIIYVADSDDSQLLGNILLFLSCNPLKGMSSCNVDVA